MLLSPSEKLKFKPEFVALIKGKYFVSPSICRHREEGLDTIIAGVEAHKELERNRTRRLGRGENISHKATPKPVKFLEVIEQLKLKPQPTAVYRDVGGGTGEMAQKIKDGLGLKKAPKIYEVADYGQPSCEIVRYCADGTIPEPANSVDFATMNMVLHHVQDPEKLLTELHRVMTDGAIFIMRETDTEGDFGIECFQHIMDHHWYKAHTHSEQVDGVPLAMHFYSKSEIVKLFEANGFICKNTVIHKGDKGSVFHPVFFVFENNKRNMDTRALSYQLAQDCESGCTFEAEKPEEQEVFSDLIQDYESDYTSSSEYLKDLMQR